MATVLIAIDGSEFAENAFRCKYRMFIHVRPYWDCIDMKYGKISYRRIIRCTFLPFIRGLRIIVVLLSVYLDRDY